MPTYLLNDFTKSNNWINVSTYKVCSINRYATSSWAWKIFTMSYTPMQYVVLVCKRKNYCQILLTLALSGWTLIPWGLYNIPYLHYPNIWYCSIHENQTKLLYEVVLITHFPKNTMKIHRLENAADISYSNGIKWMLEL